MVSTAGAGVIMLSSNYSGAQVVLLSVESTNTTALT